MKKGKKAAIIIIAVIAAAAIVVGGLMIGGVIPTGNKRTASAKEIVVDKDTITACRNHPKTYKSSLKHLYGMTPEDVEKFYENNCLLQQAFYLCTAKAGRKAQGYRLQPQILQHQRNIDSLATRIYIFYLGAVNLAYCKIINLYHIIQGRVKGYSINQSTITSVCCL